MRDWLYVGDHCEALRIAAERGVPGETYNVGGKNERTDARDRARRSATCSIASSPRKAGGVVPRAHHLRRRPPGARSPLRHRSRPRSAASSAGSPPRRSSKGIEQDGRLVPRSPRLVRAHQQGRLPARAPRARRRKCIDEGARPGRRRRHASSPAHAHRRQAARPGRQPAGAHVRHRQPRRRGHPRHRRHHLARDRQRDPGGARRRLALGSAKFTFIPQDRPAGLAHAVATAQAVSRRRPTSSCTSATTSSAP